MTGFFRNLYDIFIRLCRCYVLRDPAAGMILFLTPIPVLKKYSTSVSIPVGIRGGGREALGRFPGIEFVPLVLLHDTSAIRRLSEGTKVCCGLGGIERELTADLCVEDKLEEDTQNIIKSTHVLPS